MINTIVAGWVLMVGFGVVALPLLYKWLAKWELNKISVISLFISIIFVAIGAGLVFA